MANKYRVTVTFHGVGTLTLEAASPEAARQQAKELTVADVARSSQTDILSFQSAAREIVPLSDTGEETDEAGVPKPRPSGWYRPL